MIQVRRPGPARPAKKTPKVATKTPKVATKTPAKVPKTAIKKVTSSIADKMPKKAPKPDAAPLSSEEAAKLAAEFAAHVNDLVGTQAADGGTLTHDLYENLHELTINQWQQSVANLATALISEPQSAISLRNCMKKRRIEGLTKALICTQTYTAAVRVIAATRIMTRIDSTNTNIDYVEVDINRECKKRPYW